MARRALEAQIAIERQKTDRERFWGNAEIAFAENDPIFRSAWCRMRLGSLRTSPKLIRRSAQPPVLTLSNRFS